MMLINIPTTLDWVRNLLESLVDRTNTVIIAKQMPCYWVGIG